MLNFKKNLFTVKKHNIIININKHKIKLNGNITKN